MESDIDLHPYVSPGLVSVNQFELDSLYEGYQKQCEILEIRKSENEVLQTLLSNAHSIIRDLEEKNNYLSNNVQILTSKLHVQKCKHEEREQEIQHRISQLEETSNVVPHESPPGGANSTVNQTTAVLEREIARLVEVNQKAELSLEHLLRAGEEFQCKKCAQQEKLECKVKQLEALMDLLVNEKKTLVAENKRLSSKIEILSQTNADEDDTIEINIKRHGRFEIKMRSFECVQCHESFSTRSEMEASACHYHPLPPLREDKGMQLKWICCDTPSVGKKMSPGCTTGKHRLATNILGQESALKRKRL